jgi:hypothetical protein
VLAPIDDAFLAAAASRQQVDPDTLDKGQTMNRPRLAPLARAMALALALIAPAA